MMGEADHICKSHASNHIRHADQSFILKFRYSHDSGVTSECATRGVLRRHACASLYKKMHMHVCIYTMVMLTER